MGLKIKKVTFPSVSMISLLYYRKRKRPIFHEKNLYSAKYGYCF